MFMPSGVERVAKSGKINERATKVDSPQAVSPIVTVDPQMRAILKKLESYAKSNQPVLITGETGVGKGLFAKAAHDLSDKKGTFVSVNVAGLDDNVFSDTLFGHERGAFTGADRMRRGQIEMASGGTLFLDEIGDLSPVSQVKLLQLLQEGDYLPLGADRPKKADCRIVTATNHDLWGLQKSGTFRKDLNFRLRTHHINIPPLRDRRDDLPLLLDLFLDKAAKELGMAKPSVPKELVTLLKTYSFPGNVRELQAMIFDAVSLHPGGVLSLDAFRNHLSHRRGDSRVSADPGAPTDGGVVFSVELPTIKEATRLLVMEAMRRAEGNQTIASEMLGITRQALGKRLKNIAELDNDVEQ